MSFLKTDKKFFFFLLLLGLYWGIALEPAMLIRIYVINNIYDKIIIFLDWCFVSFMALCLLGLLAINKYVFAIFFPVLNIICAVLTYYLIAFNYTFNSGILDAALHCDDMRIVMDVISWQLVLFVIVYLGISILFVWYRFKIGSIAHPIWYSLPMLMIILAVNLNRHYNYTKDRVPYNLYYVCKDYLQIKKKKNNYRPDQTAGTTCNEDSLTVVYVQGESLREDHLSLNGYVRQTTPLLQRDSVISFSNIYSPYTYTNPSLAYIFTNADSLHENRAYTNRSFISFFKKCGFKTIWIGNQELDEGFVYYAHECDSIVLQNIGEFEFDYKPSVWLDEDLLQPYKNFIAQHGKLKLAVVHTIGSHYFYTTHYTKDFAVFKPELTSRIITLNTQQQIINSYDNTILYMDFVVDQIIQSLKDKNAMLIFLSDHGESLGENGKWLHAHNEEMSNHRPACFVWLSDKYKQQNPLAAATLKHNAHLYFNSSFLFPSILDAAHIHTPLLDTNMSIFRMK